MLLILYVHFSPLYRSVSFLSSIRMIKTQWIDSRTLNTNDDMVANVVNTEHIASSSPSIRTVDCMNGNERNDGKVNMENCLYVYAIR